MREFIESYGWGHSSPLVCDTYTTHQVRPVVSLIIDNGKDLGLNTNLGGSVGENTIRAEDTIIERGLVLVGSTTCTGSRVGPTVDGGRREMLDC